MKPIAAVAAALFFAGCVEGVQSYDYAQDAGLDSGTWTDAAVDASTSDASEDAGDVSDAALDAGNPDAGPCETAYYRDADGDGYGDPSDSVDVPCHLDPPDGYVDNGDDCYDDNPNAKPGQTRFYRDDRGDGSFDHDCDEVEALQFPDWQVCADSESDPPVEGSRGWVRICYEGSSSGCNLWNEMPDCGESGQWANTDQCPSIPAAYATQGCR